MTKKILCVGDSFTYGDELPDPSSQAWPIILGKMNDWNITNAGKSGSSNERSIRLVFEEMDNGYDLIIISWTVWSRFEVFHPDFKTPVSLAPRTYELYGANWCKEYYGSWYNDEHMYSKMLTQIIQMQSYLNSINQKYVFGLVYGDYINPVHMPLINKIDTSKFVSWPNTFDSIVKSYPRGPNGHPLEDGHIHLATVMNDFIYSQYPSFK